MPVYLTAIIKSKPEHTATIKALLQNLVVQSKQEAACQQYDLHQAIDEPNLFIFHEVWKSPEELDAHNQQPYIQHLVATARLLLQEPLVVYKTALI